MSVQASLVARMNSLWRAGVVCVFLGACGGKALDAQGTEASGDTTNSTGSGGSTATTTLHTAAGAAVIGAGGAAITTTAKGGAGTVIACAGIPGAEPEVSTIAPVCSGTTVEVDRLPVDMIVLIDRSYATGFAYGTNDTAPAATGQLRRWDALSFAMASLVAVPEAAWLRGSVTFFGSGGVTDASTCNASDYAQPAIPLDWLSLSASTITATMQSIVPAGVSPTVPALSGTYLYAMAQQASDRSREKVVVLIGDGWPTACAVNLPSDVTSVIAEAATAPVPIRTFIVGVGSRATLEATKGNLQALAAAGGTDRPAYLLDEAGNLAGFQEQFVHALLDIAHSPRACEYELLLPSSDWVIDPNQLSLAYPSDTVALEELPKLESSANCPKSSHGGWYFDDPVNPSKIVVCPCTCANYGKRPAALVFGCKPIIMPD